MKYQLIIDETKEESIVITIHKKTKLIDEIEELLNSEIINLFGYKEGSTHLLEVEDVYVFYTLDGKVYAKTKNDTFLIKQRIYQLEEITKKLFVKINQGCLINISKILRFESNLDGSIKVVLKNNYTDYISRRELKNVKRRIGLWKNIY